MFDDELDDDASSASGPIHPDDRLWRHPSEVGAAMGASAAKPAPSGPHGAGRIWTVAVLAGLTGAAVAITTLAVTGTFRTKVVEREATITPVSATAVIDPSPTPKAVSKIVDETAAVMAQLTVVAGSRERRGSGLVVRDDGSVLTSEALVRDADQVTVTLAGGRMMAATVTGTDRNTGLAVVKVAVAGLRVATADRTGLQPGDPAVIVSGAAAPGEKPWVTSGVVSSVDGQAATDDHDLAGLIETSTPLPTAADGSALVGPDGTVSGLCILLEGKDEASSAGYAIPISAADGVADDIIRYGRARTAWLGVSGDPLGRQAATTLGVAGGAKVTKVMTDSPAQAAGLEAGDVVTAVAERPVHSMDVLIGLLPLQRPDEQVNLTIYRGSTRMTVRVTLAEKP